MKRIVCLIAVSLFGACAAWAASASDKYPIEAQGDGVVESLDVSVIPAAEELRQEGSEFVWWQQDFTKDEAKFIRLRIADLSLGQVAFTLSIQGLDGEGEKVRSEDLKGKAIYWTGMLSSGTVTVSLLAATRPDGRFKIDRIAYQQEQGAALSITEPDKRQHIALFDNRPVIWAAQAAVGRISFISGNALKVCTGFMVSKDMLVTNHHCVPTNAICQTTTVVFGYQLTRQGEMQSGQQYKCAAVLEANYNYDYALLRMSDSPGTSTGMLTFNTAGVAGGQQLYVIQHPAGQPKQISEDDCKVVAPTEDGRTSGSDFSHLCDTLGGSSGSPVLNEMGQVVGLHHYGFADGIYWKQNRAIRAAPVKAAIDRH